MAYRSAFSTEFIKDRVEVVGKIDCWLWQKSKDPEGYGRVGPGAPERFAHRLSYHLFIGPIPEGMTVDHICFVTSCVNPAHLRLLTRSENCKRQRMQLQFVKPDRPRDSACKNGHSRAENEYVSPDGKGRYCRVCQREIYRRYNARRRAA